MTTHVRLAPGNATDRDLVVAEVCDPLVHLADAYDAIRANDRHPSPDWMPWLVAEWGLGELSPYVPNPYLLCSVGPGWQRIRGTPAAVTTGLGWVGYAATFEHAPPRRRRWHLWQMRVDRLPDAERPDLDRIDGIASLSDDATAHFWRGHRGYDVRPAETGARRWGEALWGTSSGVRISQRGALWSFGRRHEADRTASEADLTTLDAWIPPTGSSDIWSEMHIPWTTATYPWAVPGRQARRAAIVGILAVRRWHLVLRATDGAVIGACPLITHPVAEVVGGVYRVGASTWSPTTTPTGLLLLARTPFEAAPGAVISSVDLVSGAALAAGVKPGRRWLEADEIDPSAGRSLTVLTGLAVTMAATVREIVTCLLRID